MNGRFYRPTRALHLYLRLFISPLVLVFSVSGEILHIDGVPKPAVDGRRPCSERSDREFQWFSDGSDPPCHHGVDYRRKDGPIFNASITDNVTPDGASGMWFSALIAIALGAVLCSAMLGRKRKGRDSVR